MNTILYLGTGAVALELFVHVFGRFAKVRNILALLTAGLGSFAAGALLFYSFNLFSFLLLLLTGYRVFNIARLFRRQMHEHYLRRATRRTTLNLLGLQVLIIAGWVAWNEWHVTGHGVWAAMGALQVGIALIFLVSTVRTLRKTAWTLPNAHFSDAELPTVSVLIPARNETEDLRHCLESVIASTYPKLEVIVLDDCSQTRRTPEIVRGFAHAGVRFVQGYPPKETWLPKNQAYARLAEEASGQYLLFCGVDVRFTPHSIQEAISMMLSRQKRMLCLLPRSPQKMGGRSSLIQAMRYWWELVPPRRFFNRPPVLSSCWIIDADALRKAGGFQAVSRSIVPEAHFAKRLLATDEYSFMRASDALGIESVKQNEQQKATAMRMRYPQLHRRPEQAALVALFEGFFLIGPLVLVVAGFWVSVGLVAQLSAAVAGTFLLAAYGMMSHSTRVQRWWTAPLAFPFAVVSDIALVHYSMYKYEFSIVEWKGRNICVPAMHVVPHLPRVKD